MDFLSKEEMSTERDAKALVSWFDEKFRLIIKDEAVQQSLRLRKGLYKQFMEEIHPLRLLAEVEFSSRRDVYLKWICGNQNYDAVIRQPDFSSDIMNKLEITQAEEPHSYLRRLMHNKEGWAPLDGRLIEKSSKNRGEKFNTKKSYARDLGSQPEIQIKLISKAVDRKLENKYGDNTSLLVVFDDKDFQHLGKAINHYFQEFAQEKWTVCNQFSVLYVIGMYKNIFVKYPMNA